MAITLSSSFSDIADAIRDLRSSSSTYTPTEMAAAISALSDPLSGGSLSVAMWDVWANGTDNDVITMVQAADAGKIDLTDYWSVGDTRTVRIGSMSATGVSESHSAQNVDMVLMHPNPSTYTYVTPPASGRTHPFFIYGQKNCLTNLGYIAAGNSVDNVWSICERRTWCNNIYYNAVSSLLKTITKQVNVITVQPKSATSTTTVQDYFFLPALKEILGESTFTGSSTVKVSYANQYEHTALEQWIWYRLSYKNAVKNSPVQGWYTRSMRSTNISGESGGYYFVIKNSNATYKYYIVDTITITTKTGISPCGCI